MTRNWALLVCAPILVAAAPYSNDRLANGFAQFVVMGKDIAPLTSTNVPEDVLVNIKWLQGCKIVQVELLATKYIGYGVQWRCPHKAKGMKTAAVIKIADGKIFQILMSDVS